MPLRIIKKDESCKITDLFMVSLSSPLYFLLPYHDAPPCCITVQNHLHYKFELICYLLIWIFQPNVLFSEACATTYGGVIVFYYPKLEGNGFIFDIICTVGPFSQGIWKAFVRRLAMSVTKQRLISLLRETHNCYTVLVHVFTKALKASVS